MSLKNAAFVKLLLELGHLLAKNRPLLAEKKPPCLAESYAHLHQTCIYTQQIHSLKTPPHETHKSC